MSQKHQRDHKIKIKIKKRKSNLSFPNAKAKSDFPTLCSNITLLIAGLIWQQSIFRALLFLPSLADAGAAAPLPWLSSSQTPLHRLLFLLRALQKSLAPVGSPSLEQQLWARFILGGYFIREVILSLLSSLACETCFRFSQYSRRACSSLTKIFNLERLLCARF